MIQVAQLTTEQKDSLIGQKWDDETFFNPIQDNNNNWIISTTEVNGCTNNNYLWVKELPLINFEPKIVELP